MDVFQSSPDLLPTVFCSAIANQLLSCDVTLVSGTRLALLLLLLLVSVTQAGLLDFGKVKDLGSKVKELGTKIKNVTIEKFRKFRAVSERAFS